MNKQDLISKWGYYFNDYFIADLNSVIDNEIAKAQPEKTNKIEITPHTLVEVNRAFRALKQDRNSYIHKVFSDDGVFDAMEEIRQVYEAYFGGEERQIKPEDAKPQPALNPISEAYERGEKVRRKKWAKNEWIQKYSELQSITNLGDIFDNSNLINTLEYFKTNPEEWEIYTEPNEQPAKPFDKERFEAMFRAVVASEAEIDFVFRRNETNYLLEQLDAYYASKNN